MRRLLCGAAIALVSACAEASEHPRETQRHIESASDDRDAGSSPDAGTGTTGPEDPQRDSGTPDDVLPVPLVVVTLNTHSFQEQGCVEPGGAKLCSLLRLEQIGAGLAALDADVIGLNEVMSGQFFSYDYGGESYDGAELIRLSLERASGASYNVVSFPFATWSTGERMSNVILSRAPIVESEARAITTTDFWPAPDDARGVGYARIDLAGAGFVNVFVTHAWGWDSVDTEPQIADVKTFMAEKYRGDEALDVLVGDLNMPSTAVGYSSWLQSPPFVLVDMQASAEPELPTMLGGEYRIDYVLAGTGPDWLTLPGRSFSRRVFDGGELPIVSDHFGVATTFLVDHSSPQP